MVISLGQGAYLHMVQLIPLPLTVSCSSKSILVLPFWYRLTQVVLDKWPLNGCCVIVAGWLRFTWFLLVSLHRCLYTLAVVHYGHTLTRHIPYMMLASRTGGQICSMWTILSTPVNRLDSFLYASMQFMIIGQLVDKLSCTQSTCWHAIPINCSYIITLT